MFQSLAQGRSTIIDARGQFGRAGLGTGLRSALTASASTSTSAADNQHTEDGSSAMSLARDSTSGAEDREEAETDARESDDDDDEGEDENDEVGIPRWGMLMVSDDPSQVCVRLLLNLLFCSLQRLTNPVVSYLLLARARSYILLNVFVVF
jgi:hypothetical protein